MWPYYDTREKNCVCHLLKSCGGRINKRLSFPDHVPPPVKLDNMLQNCNSVIELSLLKKNYSRGDQHPLPPPPAPDGKMLDKDVRLI